MAPESSLSASAGQSVRVSKPALNETLTLASVPGGNLAFDFDPATATATRSGNDLVFDVDGGGRVVLTDFFVVGDSALPSLTLPDGTSVASADFLAGFNMDISTAAGPAAAAAGAPGSGMNEYADDAGSLVGGVDRLGSLGTIHWSYSSEVPEDYRGVVMPAAAGPGGTPGDTPGDNPADPYLHAHDNALGLIAGAGESITVIVKPGEWKTTGGELVEFLFRASWAPTGFRASSAATIFPSWERNSG